MEYRKLGNTDMHVSRISFGCMSLKQEPESEYLLHKAIDGGINFFDTADLYTNGANEIMVGRALKEKRNQVFIATKVGNKWRPDGSVWDWDASKDYILAAIEKSLGRLGVDYIDLYQLHGGTIDDPADETIEAFELLKSQGKIRYYGISSIRPNVIRRWVERSHLSSVMMQYSLLDQRPAEECLPLLLEKGIGVLARGSLAQGMLVNKPAKPYLNRSAEEVQKASDLLGDLAGSDAGKTSLALQYVLHDPAISSAVVGMSKTQQLEEVLAVGDDIGNDHYRALAAAVAPNLYQDHR